MLENIENKKRKLKEESENDIIHGNLNYILIVSLKIIIMMIVIIIKQIINKNNIDINSFHNLKMKFQFIIY